MSELAELERRSMSPHTVCGCYRCDLEQFCEYFSGTEPRPAEINRLAIRGWLGRQFAWP
jgi:hypothetical protein